jgi:hypothetical protein
MVPEPYDPEAEIAWSPAWSLTRDRFAQVPTAYAYYDVPRELGADYFLADVERRALRAARWKMPVCRGCWK